MDPKRKERENASRKGEDKSKVRREISVVKPVLKMVKVIDSMKLETDTLRDLAGSLALVSSRCLKLRTYPNRPVALHVIPPQVRCSIAR